MKGGLARVIAARYHQGGLQFLFFFKNQKIKELQGVIEGL
jgi:hypothetical protein